MSAGSAEALVAHGAGCMAGSPLDPGAYCDCGAFDRLVPAFLAAEERASGAEKELSSYTCWRENETRDVPPLLRDEVSPRVLSYLAFVAKTFHDAAHRMAAEHRENVSALALERSRREAAEREKGILMHERDAAINRLAVLDDKPEFRVTRYEYGDRAKPINVLGPCNRCDAHAWVLSVEGDTAYCGLCDLKTAHADVVVERDAAVTARAAERERYATLRDCLADEHEAYIRYTDDGALHGCTTPMLKAREAREAHAARCSAERSEEREKEKARA